MNVRKFVLSYYENAASNFHITRISSPREALHNHSHNYFQIYYVISGRLIHHLENSTAELTAGDIFILPPDQPHYIENPDGEVDFYSLSFLSDYFQNVSEANKLILDFLLYLQRENTARIAPKVTLSYEDTIFSNTLFKRILAEFSGNKTGKNEIIRESVSVLLSLFARVYFEQNAAALVAKENRQLVMHSIEYIKNHFDEEITLSEILRRAAMSKTNFCTIFHSITGMPFKEYLNRCRIERAAELIAAGEKVSVAGIRCGYSDFSTFYRNFKKYMGMSASQFANKNRP
jgi:AraC-like DNA-binding protein/quercetin dioxygenase-like cupin family protein